MAQPIYNPLWQASPAYHGVLVEAGEHRLIVSPNGKRYNLQERDADGAFDVINWRKSLALLLPDLPPKIMEKGADILSKLPDDPLEYERHWAGEIQATVEAFEEAKPSSDRYSGVIANGSKTRLVFVPGSRPVYAVQRKTHQGWKRVYGSKRASLLIQFAMRERQTGTERAKDAEMVWRFVPELAGLRDLAADYEGRRPKRFTELIEEKPHVSARAGKAKRKAHRPQSGGRKAPKRLTAAEKARAEFLRKFT